MLLEFLFTHAVQPDLGDGCVFVHDYPASQAALARVRDATPPVAERFELFEMFRGVVMEPLHQLRRELVERRS